MKQFNKIKAFKYFLLAFLLFAAGRINAKSGLKDLPFISQSASFSHLLLGDTTYRIIPSVEQSFGYEILVNNKLLIRQPSIPGRPGNKGFEQKKDAEKVARLVINKMQKGMMPPTIEQRELDSLKIKY